MKMKSILSKIDAKDLQPSKKQFELYEKLLKGPAMTKKQMEEFNKTNKWMRKWKV